MNKKIRATLTQCTEKWSKWWDSNPRPFGPEPNALPDCATPRSGADKGTRTLDLLITNQPLYQLSYIGTATSKNLSATIIITEAREKVNPFLGEREKIVEREKILAAWTARGKELPMHGCRAGKKTIIRQRLHAFAEWMLQERKT